MKYPGAGRKTWYIVHRRRRRHYRRIDVLDPRRMDRVVVTIREWRDLMMRKLDNERG